MKHTNLLFCFLIVLACCIITICVCNGKGRVLYKNTTGFYIDGAATDELQLHYDTMCVCDEWARDSLIVAKQLFDIKTNMHAAENVIRYGVSGYPNEEYYIEQAKRDSQIYQTQIDSLQKCLEKLHKDKRKTDNDISYIKITGAIIRKRV